MFAKKSHNVFESQHDEWLQKAVSSSFGLGATKILEFEIRRTVKIGLNDETIR